MSGINKLPLLITFNLTLNKSKKLLESEVFERTKEILSIMLKDTINTEWDALKNIKKLKEFLNIELNKDNLKDEIILDELSLKNVSYRRCVPENSISLQVNIFKKKTEDEFKVKNIPVKTRERKHPDPYSIDEYYCPIEYKNIEKSNYVLFVDFFKIFSGQSGFEINYSFHEA